MSRTLMAATLLVGGCLSTTHRIPKADLMALSQTPPAERGRSVRVIQGFAGEEGPPEAPAVHVGAAVVLTPGPAPVRRTPAPAKAQASDSKAWIALAVIAALGFALTEGLRFDGWAELHPMHPVHLYGPWGEYTWVPLAQLDPQTAAWASRAFVREGEGPWRRLERAPLDRVGLTYGVLLGASELPSVDGSSKNGFMAHIQFGGFPIQQVGILLDFALAYGENELGATVTDNRNALELQVIPLQAGIFHGGGFGQVGFARRLEDGPGGGGETDVFYGGGALLQLDLTTRLALTGRAGMAVVYDETTTDFTVGLSIY